MNTSRSIIRLQDNKNGSSDIFLDNEVAGNITHPEIITLFENFLYFRDSDLIPLLMDAVKLEDDLEELIEDLNNVHEENLKKDCVPDDLMVAVDKLVPNGWCIDEMRLSLYEIKKTLYNLGEIEEVLENEEE